jgi:hypothetical protein
VAEAASDVGNGNSFANDGATYLIAHNSDAGDHTVTIRGTTWTVTAGKSVVIGPFPVYSDYGSTVTVAGSDATVKLLAYAVPDRNSSLR